MLYSVVAICFGAIIGAIMRWLIGLYLNPIFPLIPLGTLMVNLVGGYLVGFAISFFASFPNLDPAWRLLVMTGFLGALTTFSTFSAEVSSLLQQGRLFYAGGVVVLHVGGSLVLTFLGMASFALLKSTLR
jgi:crcB protein